MKAVAAPGNRAVSAPAVGSVVGTGLLPVGVTLLLIVLLTVLTTTG